MFKAMPSWCAIVLGAMAISSSIVHANDLAMTWTVTPSYETVGDKSSALIITDDTGRPRKMYDASYATLIVEEHYSNGWTSPIDAGERSLNLLKQSLEDRGFHVFIWKDLKGAQLQIILNEIESNIGYQDDARLFFYYFGHGTSVGTPDDLDGPRTFLVPTDAPDQNIDLQAFYRRAVPISRLSSMASEMTLKHAFFALEACRAGGIISTLGAPPPPNPAGYLFGQTIKKHVRQFLTAGNEKEDVPSGAFTGLLLRAFEEGGRNDEGYIYTSDVISFVAHEAPRYSPKDFPLDPLYASIPSSGGGDMIIGPSPALTAKPMVKPSQPSYLACRLPENGIESWQHEAAWAGQSDWLSGGNNQTSVCQGLAAGWMQSHPSHIVDVDAKSTTEISRKDFVGHVEYQYSCRGTERADPTFKLTQSPACGVDTGLQPLMVQSETIFLESGGTSDNRSDVCKTHQTEICLKPTTPVGRLVPGTAQFKTEQRSGGVFVDGAPINNNPIGTSNIGWFVNTSDNSPEKICVTLYARTSACENRVFIGGKLVAQEVPAR
jgi:hypothetical protein